MTVSFSPRWRDGSCGGAPLAHAVTLTFVVITIAWCARRSRSAVLSACALQAESHSIVSSPCSDPCGSLTAGAVRVNVSTECVDLTRAAQVP